MARHSRPRPDRTPLANPYALDEDTGAPRAAVAAAVLTGAAGLAVLAAGPASADEPDAPDAGASSSAGASGTATEPDVGRLLGDLGSVLGTGGSTGSGTGDLLGPLTGTGVTGSSTASSDTGTGTAPTTSERDEATGSAVTSSPTTVPDVIAPVGSTGSDTVPDLGANPTGSRLGTGLGDVDGSRAASIEPATEPERPNGAAPVSGLDEPAVTGLTDGLLGGLLGTDARGAAAQDAPSTQSAPTAPRPVTTGTAGTTGRTVQSPSGGTPRGTGTGTGTGTAGAAGFGDLLDLGSSLDPLPTPTSPSDPFAADVAALTGGGLRLGVGTPLTTSPTAPTTTPFDGLGLGTDLPGPVTDSPGLGTDSPGADPLGLGTDPFGLGTLSSPELQAPADGTARGGQEGENPWRITTFDEENWPPRLQLEPRDIGYALGGVLPTVGLTANQRRIANGTSLAGELAPSAGTLFRSVPSDLLLGASPIEVFEGHTQNEVAKSLVSGGVITALDEVARTAQRNLPEIQRRNTEYWSNRNSSIHVPRARAPHPLQLSSGLARPTIFSVAPTVTALNLGADALTDRFDLDPEPTDRNNNRYYGELLTDSLATGAGVFLPIFGENWATARAAALRAGTPVPKVGNVAAQTALAFGLPALQTFGAGILTEEPPDKTDPIYRGTRAAFQFVGDGSAAVGDAAFGEGDAADGNGLNSTRALGNAAATLATPVLDAVGGAIPNVFANLGHTYDYLTTDERRPRTEPVVSDEALAAAEAARVRTGNAWQAAREGDARNRWDDLGKLGANALYLLGRGTIGLAHTATAPLADPFRSEESRVLGEPTQAERGRDSFQQAQRAWQDAGEAVQGLLGWRPAPQRDGGM